MSQPRQGIHGAHVVVEVSADPVRCDFCGTSSDEGPLWPLRLIANGEAQGMLGCRGCRDELIPAAAEEGPRSG